MSTTATTSDELTLGVVDTNPDKPILYSMAIYLSVLIVAFVAFELVRPRLLYHFNCRAKDPKQFCPAAQKTYGFFGWILPVLSIHDDETIEFCGLDALVFLRFLRFGRHIALAGCILSCGLIPIYATAVPLSNDTSTDDLLTRYAMANMNVKLDPNRMWAPAIAGAFLLVVVLVYVRREWQVYLARRHGFLGLNGLQQYTVLIDDLPLVLRTKKALEKYLKQLFPGKIDTVSVALECGKVESLVKTREQVLGKLERAMLLCNMQPGARPTVRIRGRGRVDAVDHYSTELEKLNRSIKAGVDELVSSQTALFEQMNEESLEDAAWVVSSASVSPPSDHDELNANEILKKMRPSAFVSFNSLLATQSALQMLQTDNVAEMRITPAPDPNDIVWSNVGRTLQDRTAWSLVAFLVTTAIIALWSIPTIAIVSLSNIDQMRQKSETLDRLFSDHPWLISLFKQLSPLGLIIGGEISSIVFAAISRREGSASQTEVDASAFTKLVYFHFFQTFIVALCAGSLVAVLQVITDKPFEVIRMLSQAVPQQASLYISYLLILTGLTLPLKLFRVHAAIKAALYHWFAPRLTPRERRSPWHSFTPMSKVEAVDQWRQLPLFFVALLVVVVFSPITPMVSWFGLLLFVIADIVYRRLFFFVYAPGRFTTGVYWPQMYGFIISGLYVSQVLLIGMLWFRVSDSRSAPDIIIQGQPTYKDSAYWYAMAPTIVASSLPVVTFFADLHNRRLYPRAAKFLPLIDCSRIDALRESLEHDRLKMSRSVYVQPALLQGPALVSEIEVTPANTYHEVVDAV
ncbi:hypothetical protein LEN26_018809 [Aphanomyces euteiches]|nr:hypothetical protein LEN26_018809 [Aphanomyces euteiches]KAH9123030.1 hypothetical protein AeMF1_005870 [Aphanomyces euteiches]KAH9188957.1 hypothetical protein AeNC1_009070 [Aphanomyces euteiches]